VWTAWRPSWMPWFLESYVNGVHTFGRPQTWLFPVFPWAAFCFAGLACGFFLRSEAAVLNPRRAMLVICIAGLSLWMLAWAADASPIRLYRDYDFWHTSPNFFFMRVTLMLLILAGCYAVERVASGAWFFDRMVLLGQASLLVYWVHIEFVYGRLSILPKRKSSVPAATLGLIVITTAMFALASYRRQLATHLKQVTSRFSRQPEAVREF
jgi:fucose 4-O-acetylase-like acetyltransferase